MKLPEGKMDLDQPENINFTNIIKNSLLKDNLYICFGGGVGAFGRNFSIFQFNNCIIWIDIGCGFPSHNLPGLQRSIPAKELMDAFQPDAVILTHGHEDHIGAIPYIYKHIPQGTPLYSSNFTTSLIRKKLIDCKINPDYFKFVHIEKNTRFQVKEFIFNTFFVPHSIPEAFSVGITIQKTGYKIFFTSDFKTDGSEGNYSEVEIKNFGPVDALFCDSTGALNSGSSSNEAMVKKNLEHIIKNWKGRILFTTFASQIERLYSLSQIAKSYGRKIGIRGQSILTHLDSANEAKILKETFWYSRKPEPDDPDSLWIISGCQADKGSSFFRFSEGRLSGLTPKKDDLLIYSASVIPSNTEFVMEAINNIARKGVKIIGLAEYDPKVHTSGHARSEDLKKIILSLKPSKIIPVHGDHLHFQGFSQLLVNHPEIKIEPLEDHCIYNLGDNTTEVMRVPAIPQLIEEKEVHTEYSLYSYRLNFSVSGICNVLIDENTKNISQLQYIGTSSQDWLKQCMPELTEKIQRLVNKHYSDNENNRNRKLKQKIAKINTNILGKNPYVNIIWL